MEVWHVIGRRERGNQGPKRNSKFPLMWRYVSAHLFSAMSLDVCFPPSRRSVGASVDARFGRWGLFHPRNGMTGMARTAVVREAAFWSGAIRPF
jgi:hypothetical protein